MGLLDFLNKAITAAGDAAKEASDYIYLEKEVQIANSDLEIRIHAEKYTIDSAISVAKTLLEIEIEMENDAQFRETYLQVLSELNGGQEMGKKKYGSGKGEDDVKISFPPEIDRIPHKNAEVEKEILKRRGALLYERDKHFDNVKIQLSSDARLRGLVQKSLQEMGCNDCWNRIS